MIWDHASVLLVNAVGAAGLLCCWVGSATQTTWHTELPWLDGAITAAIVVVVSDAIWLMGGMKQVRSLRRDLILRVGTMTALPIRPAGPSTSRYVSAPRMSFYHEPSCLMVGNKPLTSVSAEEADSEGLRRCPVCLP